MTVHSFCIFLVHDSARYCILLHCILLLYTTVYYSKNSRYCGYDMIHLQAAHVGPVASLTAVLMGAGWRALQTCEMNMDELQPLNIVKVEL